MLPDKKLSQIPIFGEYFIPDTHTPPNPTIDFERGGVDIQNPSQGLMVKDWAVYIQGNDVMIAADDRPPVIWFTRAGVLTEVSLAFDQNMRPAVAFVEDGVAWLNWYDTAVANYVFTQLPGAVTPRVCLDDKRPLQTGTSDIILAYIKDNNLYFRAQRDRFSVEYLLRETVNATLEKLGMTNKLRVQFKLIPVT